MVQPAKFRNIEFEWDEGNVEELIRHGIDPEEAEEFFFNKYRITRNKRKAGRSYETFKLQGRTNGGRSLWLVFFVKGKTTVRSIFGACALIRVITGWEG